MPARRSDAEGEIRTDVVAWLRASRPLSRIIHEINVCEGGNRIDVIAVGAAEIIAVEIKSELDKLDRAPAQITAMRGVAHHVYTALHKRFMVPKMIFNMNNADFVAGDVAFSMVPPDEIKKSVLLVWPKPQMDEFPRCSNLRPWPEPDLRNNLQRPLPGEAIHMLWREELWDMCATLGVDRRKRATKQNMINALRWQCSGSNLTKGICTQLRGRKCVEADPKYK